MLGDYATLFREGRSMSPDAAAWSEASLVRLGLDLYTLWSKQIFSKGCHNSKDRSMTTDG